MARRLWDGGVGGGTDIRNLVAATKRPNSLAIWSGIHPRNAPQDDNKSNMLNDLENENLKAISALAHLSNRIWL